MGLRRGLNRLGGSESLRLGLGLRRGLSRLGGSGSSLRRGLGLRCSKLSGLRRSGSGRRSGFGRCSVQTFNCVDDFDQMTTFSKYPDFAHSVVG